ncbi:HDOD domain-containing protein [Dasania marina]|uniref:HDOD domain-containing protein n=1 Tax=Dasania marina TaxID=471499 RepID=UPI0030D9559D|tara:strand:- start:114987 stop:115832 length:846 start_codon:yes stop_codon:yes gene_type:complete
MQQAVYDSLSQQLEKKILAQSLSLPMLPQVTINVLNLVNDVDSDAAALSRLIQSDQALAGHVMRIANSAAYSPAAKMTSLQQAIARLGMQNIAEIAMAATLGPKLFVAPGFEQLIKDLWVASLSVAVWAKEIARKARKNVESTFLSGLLFQIGRPTVLQSALECAQELKLELDVDTAQRLIDRYQQQVGLLLAERWQLPAAVAETMANIDSSEAQSRSQDVIDAIRAARVFTQAVIVDGDCDVQALASHPHVVAMNLYASDVAQLLEKLDDINETIEALKL